MKREVLELCYRVFLRENFEGLEPELKPKTDRGKSFLHFTEREGESLAHYALFQALEEERQSVHSLDDLGRLAGALPISDDRKPWKSFGVGRCRGYDSFNICNGLPRNSCSRW